MSLITELNQIGQAEFAKRGWPTKKLEAWKYTSLKVIQDKNFLPISAQTSSLSASDTALINSYKNNEFYNLVFVDGTLNTDLSDKGFKGLTEWKSLSSLDQQNISAELKKVEDGMQAWHYQNIQNAKIILIPAETSVDKPVQFIHYATEKIQNQSLLAMQIVVVGKRAKLSLVETYIGAKGNYFVAPQTHAFVMESASLGYTLLQNIPETAYQVSRTQIYLQSQAELESLSVSMGAEVFRHDLVVNTQGPATSSRVHGLYVTRLQQHHDHHTQIHHRHPEGMSDQFYKGILEDHSHSVFDGLVYIYPQAQKVNSSQLNQNLLLSSKAEIDTKPQLEIYADDVKASHGSTVGQLNKDEVFYLMSRAIPREQALQMLSLGYAAEIIYKVSDVKIQNWLLDKTLQHLKSWSKEG